MGADSQHTPAEIKSHIFCQKPGRFFLRLQVDDRPGVLASIASVLGNNDVSIAQMIQKNKDGDLAEIVVVTSKVREGNFNDAMMIIEGMSVVHKVSALIRVYGD